MIAGTLPAGYKDDIWLENSNWRGVGVVDGRILISLETMSTTLQLPEPPTTQTASAETVRILIVEDDVKIASFLQKGLKENSFAVDHVDSGEDALTRAMETQYDAAVIDLMLPGVDGLSVIRRLRADGFRAPIIVLSAKRSVDDRVECLQSGADDYVGKPFAFSELLARIQAVLRRSKGAAEPATLEVADVELDRLKREVRRAGRKIDLQPREFALLEQLMRHCGKALSKTYLLEHLWDYSFDPQTNVVDVLVCRLRNKVDKDFDRKLIHTMRGVGYVLRAD